MEMRAGENPLDRMNLAYLSDNRKIKEDVY